MTSSRKISVVLFLFMSLVQTAPAVKNGKNTSSVIDELVEELLKSNSKRGRPLPVVSHWANGFGKQNFSTDYQVSLLEKGHHILPTLPFPLPGQEHYFPAAREAMGKLSQGGAPLCFRAGQWEQLLLSKEHPKNNPGKWRNLPADETALVVNPLGDAEYRISPFGAVAPWREVGEYYTSSGAFDELKRWYPAPPLVIFLSNNEAQRLKPKNFSVFTSKRFLQEVGPVASGDVQRAAMAEGYLERYRALFEGLRAGLDSEAWNEHLSFVGYEAFGPPHFGRWHNWPNHSFVTDERIDPWHLVWDGGSPSYYTHNWNGSSDYRVHSPQVEANNWVFMLKETRSDRPEFWFELSVWDGNWGNSPAYKGEKEKRVEYLAAGQTWSANRYRGFVQYGMWLLRPRVIREFRGHAVLRKDFEKDFLAIVDAVDSVWRNPVLTKFWRTGKLVPNRSRKHPYQTGIPKKWRSVDRWFMLNTNPGPVGKLSLRTEIPVFSLALTLGEKGEREWLLYAHSPVEDRENVKIEIPDYKKVVVDVTQAGNFYLLEEQNNSVLPVGRLDRL